MTPLERACRALAELHGRDPDEPVLLLPGRKLWQEFVPQVRAVISAIREPSEGMIDAAYRREGVSADAVDVPFSLPPDDSWPVMIDAALAEGE